jgi:cytochrome c553
MTRGVTSFALALFLAATARADDPATAFRDRVAPILESRCVRCHGGTATKGGLDLTTPEALRRGGDSGPAVVPGAPGESLLMDQLVGDPPAMPRGGDPLGAAEVAALRRWIEGGAPWPEGLTLAEPKARPGAWWAIGPLSLPPVPPQAGARNPIDAFLLARLDREGLTYRPEADRRTLLRRVTFDLTGLPPTPEEVAAFEADSRPDAYERLVERLLASPHFGERWARHWLDVAHYADTHGYDKDKRRPNAWPYRDWLIAAFNADMPHDRFVQAQVAGDVLFPDDPGATVATGFVAAGPWDFVGHVELREGTVEKAKTRLLDRDDMLASTMSAFASLTVHCARCHDHKFDPIPQRDYYRLQAIFAGVDRGDRPYDDAEHARRRRELERQRAAIQARREALAQQVASQTHPDLGALDGTLADLRGTAAAFGPLPGAASATNGYHSAIAAKADAVKWVQVDLGRTRPLDEIRLVPARPVDFRDTPGFGFPARFRVELADEPEFHRPVVVADHAAADVPNPGASWWIVRPGRAARYVRVTATRLWPRTNDHVFALGELQVVSGGENVARDAVVAALDSIEAGRWSTRHLVDGADSRTRLDDPGEAARRADVWFRLREAEARRVALVEAITPEPLRRSIAKVESERARVDATLAAMPARPSVYGLVAHAPRPIHVLARGEVEQPGEAVGPGALACVPGLEATFPDAADEGERRAALARWLTDPRNPLPWRSIVNRIWHYHFGRGLVDTPNDFGRNGGAPSHPELLDGLAATLRDDPAHSLKAIHRRIVTSAAYRQASSHDERAAAIDGDNRLLWRQNRRRLEAEAIRDAILLASGRLDRRMGGPGFALFRFVDDHSPIYDHDDPAWIDPPEGRRRTVYRFVVRSVPNPFVECLDGADPNVSVPARDATITALQALTLLNDPFLLPEADALAAALAVQGGEVQDHIDRAYLRLLGRAPRPEERRALAAYAGRHGLAAACRLLFNLDEFVFVD